MVTHAVATPRQRCLNRLFGGDVSIWRLNNNSMALDLARAVRQIIVW